MYYKMLSLQLRWTTKHLFFFLEFNATFTCGNSMEMFADGQSLGKDSNWGDPTTYLVPGNTRVLSVAGKDLEGNFGIFGSVSNGLVTDESWKCSSFPYPGWNSPDFDDQGWHFANVIANHGDNPWNTINGIAKAAKWIWANNGSDTVLQTESKVTFSPSLSVHHVQTRSSKIAFRPRPWAKKKSVFEFGHASKSQRPQQTHRFRLFTLTRNTKVSCRQYIFVPSYFWM